MQEETLNGFTGFARKNQAQFQYSRDQEEMQAAGEIAFEDSSLAAISAMDRRWAWMEVNLEAIAHNVVEAKRFLRPGVKLMAVVKADAYGHGAIAVAQKALASGADCLGVATVDEALALRDAGITAAILILAEPPVTAAPLLLAKHITPSVYTAEFALAYAEEADRHNMKAPFHLALNTGMNRIGVRAEDVIAFEQQISFHRALVQEGTFTHFATADSTDTIDFNSQVRRFINAISALRTAGLDPGMVHAANSAALFRYPDVQFDMVRLGIAMYGCHPCEQTRGMVDLWPAMEIKARITDVKTVPMSEGVSYGLHYRSPGSVKICTVPLGYADGLNRGLSGKWDFILQGQPVRQVGTICMDQCMFEVDMRSFGSRVRLDPQVGDVVTIVGRDGDMVTSLTDMARVIGTIDYEVACNFSRRLPRVIR